MGHGAGDFLDPPHVTVRGFRLDDGVVGLTHDIMKQWATPQVKLILPF